MSRIYEALKQVARQKEGVESSETPLKAVPPAGGAEGKTLDEYPVEIDSPLIRAERNDREAARNVPNPPSRDRVARVHERQLPSPRQQFAPNLVTTAVHKGSLVSDPGHKLMVDDDLPLGWAESFEALAGELEKTRGARPLKTLIVSSTQRGEGRTLTAANLALALSERLKRRVLLIDGDLQRPSVGRLFTVSGTFRLSDILQSPSPDVPVTDVSPTLSVLVTEASDADAMTVLVSSAMRALLEAASHYDWILIDSPPLQSLQEAHLLAWMGDGVLLVIGAETTRRNAVQAAVRDLGGGARIVGVALNRAR